MKLTTAVLPETIADEETLDELLSRPSPALIEMMQRLEGDIIVLGVAGKMGVTLAMMAARAAKTIRARTRVIGVARFSNGNTRSYLEQNGVETIRCDLLDRDAVAALPRVDNVIYMAGRKFGTQGDEDLTWAMNVIAPDNVAVHFRANRIVAFSTGNVYPQVTIASGGCTEDHPLGPVGEYAQSCLGRERVFGYHSRVHGTPVCLLRLNYATDLRYGVLFDIGKRVYAGQPVDLTASHFNVIWQGDANNQALLCLEQATSPATAINVTGPETVSVRYAAETFAHLFERDVHFTGVETAGQVYLNNAAKATALFGYPTVPLMQMIRWQADWIKSGGRSLDKPTHFEVTNGKY